MLIKGRISRLTPLLLLLCCFFNGTLYAQVVIGSTSPPEEFAILQVDGEKQGLRLARITTIQRNNLPVTSAAAGLVIYNKDTKQVEFYDGSKWRGFGQRFDVNNGISRNSSTGNIELGGSLIRDTEIDMKDKNMNIQTSSGGNFMINSDDLVANSNSLTTDIRSFSIKNTNTSDTIVNIEKGANNKNQLIASVDNFNVGNTLKISNSNKTVLINGKFSYPHTSRGNNKVLGTDGDGNTSWVELESSSTTTPFEITQGAGSNGSGNERYYLSTANFTTITRSMNLTPGKWFVSGTLYLYTHNVNTKRNDTKSTLVRITDSQGNTLYITGEQPEAKGASTGTNNNSYSALPISHIINVPQGESKTIKIEVRPELANTFLVKNVTWLTGSHGGSFFYAVRVND